MSKDKNDYSEFIEEQNSTSIYETIGKYLPYWPWFVVCVSIAMFFAVSFLRYTNNVYNTKATVKIIDDKSTQDFGVDMSKMFSKSTINLENESALFKSYRLSEILVKNLKLNIDYVYKGSIKDTKTYNPPFIICYKHDNDSIVNNLQYSIKITRDGYSIVDEKSGESYKTNGFWMNKPLKNFPITIQPAASFNIMNSVGNSYLVTLSTIHETAINLSNSLSVEQLGKDSDIITLAISGTDGKHSEIILNNLIKTYNEDGIKDKQEVYKKTIAFADERFVNLKKELDSIEESKKVYKTNNDLSFIQEDAAASISNRSLKEQTLYDAQLQLSLAKMLKQDLGKQTEFDLLPDNIGIQNATINNFVDSYNTGVLQFQKMHTTAGSNNPALKVVINTLNNLKNNIDNSTQGYIQQLQSTINKGEEAEKKAHSNFSSLPEKEKILRSIERQQNLKESLYLLLLQKREEASINYAITVSNTKVIDYAITELLPISPKRTQIYLTAFLLGMFLPFGILFIIFSLDDKIHKLVDIERISKEIPILAEIPTAIETKDGELQKQEAFRSLVNNTNFITPSDNGGKLIFVTSAKKGEGKTFVAYNLATSYANLEKKTILIGSDFRNPQMHKYLEKNRNDIKGLSNYLHNSSAKWKDLLFNRSEGGFEFDILLAGDIPPNPTLLLSSQRLADLIVELKKEYDIIILDTAPCLLVSDSLIISKYADTTLFVVRSEVTEKNLVQYALKLSDDKKINNVAFILNGISFKNIYGYGYSYGYSYNYGYGYGYGLDEATKTWYQRGFFGRYIWKYLNKYSNN